MVGRDTGKENSTVERAARKEDSTMGRLAGKDDSAVGRAARRPVTNSSMGLAGPVKILDAAFYERPSVVTVARALLGKVLVTESDGVRTSGRIVEVEAYNGVVDRASHAFAGRRTARTEVMFGAGGTAYIYLIYGIHHLFNVVTNRKDVPHAVLVRALEPLEGIPVMLRRMGRERLDHTLTRGPGNVSRALGLRTLHTGLSLLSGAVWIGDDGFRPRRVEIGASPRIGVDYAGADAALRYRFFLKDNAYVSGPKRLNDARG